MKSRPFLFVLFLMAPALNSFASDSTFIKVHFLYGSTPKKQFKATEAKWFGGKLGGHVGIEFDSNKIIDFVPQGAFHYFAHKTERHSQFVIHQPNSFWQIFGGHPDSVKKLTIIIPISQNQQQKLDSIVKTYTNEVPYDYAFVGMRCGAAAYDILGQLGIVKKINHRKTYLKICYPKKLRKRLIRKGKLNNWMSSRKDGTLRRNWEKD